MTKRDRGSTIQRVLDLLEQIARSDTPVTATELNQQLDWPKATAHRICNQLEKEGYLQRRLDGKRFIPGQKLQNLAVGVIAHSAHRAQRHAVLMSLSRSIGETCNISYPDGCQMVYFDRVETEWPLRFQLPIGSRVPLHCTASGKLYLSSLNEKIQQDIVDQLNLDKHTVHSIDKVGRLLTELKTINKTKVGVDNEEFVDGMIALAVSITDAKGKFFAALAFHAPVIRMNLQQAMKHLPRLRAAARQLGNLIQG